MLDLPFFSDMAKLCKISYLSQRDLVNKFRFTGPFNKDDHECVLYKCSREPKLISTDTDCQVCICTFKEYFSVCFRGTESRADILTDLNAFKTKMSLENTREVEMPYVHQGFYNQYKSVEMYLASEIEKNLDKKIIISGHSLGGALATIASLFFKKKHPEIDITCITFGSPRVGCEKFAEMFDTNVKQNYRFVNKYDPVPCVPTSWRFKHVGGLQWINENKLNDQINVWRFYRFIKNTLLSTIGYGYNAIDDHSCSQYYNNILNIDK